MSFRIFSALSFEGMPDPRTLGMEPIYMAYAGSLNRATTPEGSNNFLEPDGSNQTAVGFAVRRLARAAAAVERFGYNDYFYAHANSSPQSLCFDLEFPRYNDLLDGTADPAARQAVAANLCRFVDAVKDEWKIYGHSGMVGFYAWPPGIWSKLSPGELNRCHMEVACYRDLAELSRKVDYFAPSFYRGAETLEQWEQGFRLKMKLCRAYDPAKPVYPFVTNDFQRGPKMNQPTPPGDWERVIGLVRELADGVVLWDGNDLSDPSGLRRKKWGDGPGWLKAVLP
jgi:hypothetical protein